MSEDVTAADFEDQRGAVLSLLRDVNMAESSCPAGARVSVVAFSRHTRHLIRLQERRSRTRLLEAVQNLARERTAERRHLGAAMLFVGRNVFKRVRPGKTTRKVAVFFAGGQTQDPDDVLTAVMELRAQNVASAVVALRNAPRISQALEVGPVLAGSESHHLKFILLTARQQGGSSALDRTLDSALKEALPPQAGRPRRKRALLAVVAARTARRDGAALRRAALRARCGGVAVFVVAVGGRYDQTQVEELAGLPVRQHLVHVRRLQAEERGYVLRFFRVFLSALNKGLIGSPLASADCEDLGGPEGGQTAFTEVEADGGQQSFQEQTGGQTQTDLLDVILTSGRGDGQTVELGMDLNARCQLDVDFGFQCTDSVQRWFFDRTVAACAPFWFGGCGGNANRFSSEHECFRTCGVQNPNKRLQPEVTFFSKDACVQRQDPGGCQDYAMMWFFDTVQNECIRFWYGGCDGNANRFQTQEECENLCLTHSR